MKYYNLKAYDGSPIKIVFGQEAKQILKSFKSGIYGYDSEFDAISGELRIIQIFDGKTTYIFEASVLTNSKTNAMRKFLSKKDIIKVCVDTTQDIIKLKEYFVKIHNGKPIQKELVINGFQDLQILAKIHGIRELSLDALGCRFVEDWINNGKMLGTYNPPTKDQYIYSANDAILSYKMLKPLIANQACPRWISITTSILVDANKTMIEKHLKEIFNLSESIRKNKMPHKLIKHIENAMKCSIPDSILIYSSRCFIDTFVKDQLLIDFIDDNGIQCVKLNSFIQDDKYTEKNQQVKGSRNQSVQGSRNQSVQKGPNKIHRNTIFEKNYRSKV